MRLASEENCEFLDMTGPWWQYVQESGKTYGWFRGDAVHANERGSRSWLTSWKSTSPLDAQRPWAAGRTWYDRHGYVLRLPPHLATDQWPGRRPAICDAAELLLVERAREWLLEE